MAEKTAGTMSGAASSPRWAGCLLPVLLLAGCVAPDYQPPPPPATVPARVVTPAPAPAPQPPPAVPEIPVPPPQVPRPGPPVPPPSSGATSALLQQGRQQAAAGEYALATASIERALRINSRDPALWLERARVKLAEGDRAQAGSMARRALSLAGDDPARRAQCEALIEAAQR
jgi:hypothetical protein